MKNAYQGTVNEQKYSNLQQRKKKVLNEILLNLETSFNVYSKIYSWSDIEPRGNKI